MKGKLEPQSGVNYCNQNSPAKTEPKNKKKSPAQRGAVKHDAGSSDAQKPSLCAYRTEKKGSRSPQSIGQAVKWSTEDFCTYKSSWWFSHSYVVRCLYCNAPFLLQFAVLAQVGIKEAGGHQCKVSCHSCCHGTVVIMSGLLQCHGGFHVVAVHSAITSAICVTFGPWLL